MCNYVNLFDFHHPLVQNLFRKRYILYQNLRDFNTLTNSLKYLIFPTMALFRALRCNPLKNQILLCISTNHEPPKTLEPNMIWDPNEVKARFSYFFPLKTQFHRRQIDLRGSSKVYGTFQNNTFLFHNRIFLFYFKFEFFWFILETIPISLIRKVFS